MTASPADDILVRLRAEDPVGAAPFPTEPDIETALHRLHARHAGGSHDTGRRRRVPALVLACGVVALAAVVLALTFSPSGSVRVSAAQARAIVHGAAVRLRVAPGVVLETAETGVQRLGNGRVVTRWHNETWEETSRPYDARWIQANIGHRAWEAAQAVGRLQLYDPARHVIYTGEEPSPYVVTRTASGDYRLRLRGSRRTGEITARQLARLRDGEDTIAGNGIGVIPYAALDHAPLDVRTAALAILRSPHPRVRRGVTFAGRSAIEIFAPGRRFGIEDTYYVAPHTFAPLGLVQHFVGEVITLRYTMFRTLALTTAHRALVTLAGAHPGARIDSSPADYRAASARLLQ